MAELEERQQVFDLGAQEQAAEVGGGQAGGLERRRDVGGLAMRAAQDGVLIGRPSRGDRAGDVVDDPRHLGRPVWRDGQRHLPVPGIAGRVHGAIAPRLPGRPGACNPRGHGGDGVDEGRRRAVVALQREPHPTGEVLFEVREVARFGAAKSVDRLARVPDGPQVRAARHQLAQQHRAGAVHILILVDEDVPYAAAQRRRGGRTGLHQIDGAGDEAPVVDEPTRGE